MERQSSNQEEQIERFLHSSVNVFRINKNNDEHEALFLPDENNFQFLDKFERCVSVQVPDKYLEDDFNLV